jgi:hypothetical protein
VGGSGHKEGGVSVYIMDAFYIHIWKLKNESCWNCSKKGGGERGKLMEGLNSTKVYCKHHNVSPCTTIVCWWNHKSKDFPKLKTLSTEIQCKFQN